MFPDDFTQSIDIVSIDIKIRNSLGVTASQTVDIVAQSSPLDEN